jgi:hypothetical protein
MERLRPNLVEGTALNRFLDLTHRIFGMNGDCRQH